MLKKILTAITVALIAVAPSRATGDLWTYVVLGWNGFLANDMGKAAGNAAAAMALGSVGDPASILGMNKNILTDDMQRLDINSAKLEVLSGIYDNIGIRKSMEATARGTATLDKAIEFGDLNDQMIQKAMVQAEAMGLDPRPLQSLSQTVYGTARAQAFDEVLRQYEKLGGARMGLSERAAVRAQVEALQVDQLNAETLNEMAKAQKRAYDIKKEQEAEQLGKRVVQNAARQGLFLDGDYQDYAPPSAYVAIDKSVYEYDAVGGMKRLSTGPRESSPVAFVGDPFAGAVGNSNIGAASLNSQYNIPGYAGGSGGYLNPAAGLQGQPPPAMNADGSFTRTGKASICFDGSGTHPPGDTFIPRTAYEPGGKPLNGDITPYVVVNRADYDLVEMGSKAYAYCHETQMGVWAIVGDRGPDQTKSELSRAAALAIGIRIEGNGCYVGYQTPTVTIQFFGKGTAEGGRVEPGQIPATAGEFNSSAAIAKAGSDSAPSGYCARGVSNILNEQGMGNFSGLDAHDFLKNDKLANEGWTYVPGLTAETAPEGALLVYNSDIRAGNPLTTNSKGKVTGGAYYGHVEVVAYNNGNRTYVSDAARNNAGGSVPHNFAGAYVYTGKQK